MMQRIVNTTRSFAYVPNLDTYNANVGDVALKACLKEVEFLPDGRCLLEAKLEGRFRILEHFVEDGTQGLHYCRMEPFADNPIPPEESSRIESLMAEADELCRQLLQGNIKQKIEAYHGLPPREVEAFSLWLCGVCLTNSTQKMDMLKCVHTLTRLQVGLDSLRLLWQRIQNCTKRRLANSVAATAALESSHSQPADLNTESQTFENPDSMDTSDGSH